MDEDRWMKERQKDGGWGMGGWKDGQKEGSIMGQIFGWKDGLMTDCWVGGNMGGCINIYLGGKARWMGGKMEG